MKELSIEITIDELGTVEAETHGFKGKVSAGKFNKIMEKAHLYRNGISL